MEAPIETEFKVWITDGKSYGKITVAMPKGRYPTEADVDLALKQAREALNIAELQDWTLCESPRAFMRGLIDEKYGQSMDVAGGGLEEWEPPFSPREPNTEIE